MIAGPKQVVIGTSTDLASLATPAERTLASSEPYPPEAVRWLANAARARKAKDHVVAGDVERDAAALIRMAQYRKLCQIVATRLLTEPSLNVSLGVMEWLRDEARVGTVLTSATEAVRSRSPRSAA